MREWLSWWSTTLPRSGSRVRVPSRALFICSGSLDLQGFRFFIGNKRWNFYSSEIHALVYGEKRDYNNKETENCFFIGGWV